MAGISSFLTEGTEIPAGSALKATQSQTILPEYFTDYGKQILANQLALSAQPYQPYSGPRVAQLSPDQQAAFGMTRTAAGAYQPALNTAVKNTTSLAGQSALGMAQPYFNQAAGMSPVTAAQGALGTAAAYTKNATQNYGMNAANPYLAQARQNATNVSAYMDPYIEQVVQRAGDLGARSLNEQLMPQIEGRYIQAGQLGYGGRNGGGTPSGMMTDTVRALRDVDENVRAQQSALLSQGYGQAQSAMQTDLARQGQLAATAGQLGGQQQQAIMQAGQQMGALGQMQGNLTAQQQQILANIGATTGDMRGDDISRQLAAAGQLGQLGGLAQQYGLTGAAAVAGVGDATQEQAQRNLDVAYGDFLRQQGYGQEQINNMLNTLKGVAPATPTATQEVGIVPTGQNPVYEPGTAAKIGGLLTGGAAILDSLGIL